MGKLTIAPKITEKIMKVIKGAEGSPYKTVDDLGKIPDYRNPNDPPGTEKKKLKQAGEKISKFFKKKWFYRIRSKLSRMGRYFYD